MLVYMAEIAWSIDTGTGIADNFTTLTSSRLPIHQFPLAHRQADVTTINGGAYSICVNDSLLLYPGVDKSLVVWDLGSEKELGRLVGHDT